MKSDAIVGQQAHESPKTFPCTSKETVGLFAFPLLCGHLSIPELSWGDVLSACSVQVFGQLVSESPLIAIVGHFRVRFSCPAVLCAGSSHP